MPTTVDDIREWFRIGKVKGHTHFMVVCDSFEHDEYAIYVTKGEDPKKVYEDYQGKNMQRVLEVYNLNLDMEEQINTSPKTFNF